MKNTLARANAGINGNRKPEPREEKKNMFQESQGKDKLFTLALISVVTRNMQEMKPAS